MRRRWPTSWARAGLEVALVAPQPGRPSVVGRLRGTGGGRTLLLNGHMDTVGFGGMEEPLDAARGRGRLYGRGAYDMKGGRGRRAAGRRARWPQGARLRGDLLVTAVADEEHASLGTQAVLAYLRPRATGGRRPS